MEIDEAENEKTASKVALLQQQHEEALNSLQPNEVNEGDEDDYENDFET